MMASVLRSFRILGKFRFGTKDTEEDARPSQANVLDIFHLPYKTGGDYRTFVRFSKIIEGSTFPDLPQDAPPIEQNVFFPDVLPDILDALENQETVSFWISKPVRNGAGGRTLFIFDTQFLDQYGDPADPFPTARFPIVPQYAYDGLRRNSRVTFGNDIGIYSFRFEFGFAVPVPAGDAADKPLLSGGTLSLGAVFDSTRDDGNRFTWPELILTGPSNSTKVVKANYRFGEYGVAARKDASQNLIAVSGATDVPRFEPLLAVMGITGQRSATTNHVIQLMSWRNETDQFGYAVAIRGDIKLTGAGPVQFLNGDALLDLAEQFGSSMKIDDAKVTVECHWHISLQDDVIISAIGDAPTGQISVAPAFRAALRFGSTAAVNDGRLGDPSIDIPVDHGKLILRGGGLEEAARLSAVACHAMPATLRQPQSILPALYLLKSVDKLEVPLLAIARALRCGLDQRDSENRKGTITRDDSSVRLVAQFDVTLNTAPLDSLSQPPLLHLGNGKVWRNVPSIGDKIRLRMLQPTFNEKVLNPDPSRDHNHIFLAFHSDLLMPEDGAVAEPAIRFEIGNDLESAAIPHPGDTVHFAGFESRLGSLAFFRSGPLLAAKRSDLVLSRRNRRLPDMRTVAANAPRLHIDWRFSFAVDSAYPVTVDIAHGDRRERPNDLLIRETPLSAGDGDPVKSSFVLEMTESLRDDQDRLLKATLSEGVIDQAGGAPIFTVLTDAPFSAYRFSRAPIAHDRELANFDSDTNDWKLQLTEENYVLVRPPGGVGEDADKPGMLEIHDPENRAAIMRPAPTVSDGVDRSYALDMRFSPPTVMWIDPSDLKRGYMSPEYRARDLFTRSSDFGLGRKLTALRTELLYGLSTGLMVPQSIDGRPGPRVAELEALTGKMVEVREGDGDATTRRRKLQQGFRRRPERLEVWTLDTRQTDPFVPSRFDQGITSALRHTALLAPPVKSGKYLPDESSPKGIKPPRFHSRGLAGGALWPLESANITRVLGENPVGTGGELESIALTPLGDSGNQTIRFLNGYVTVITETREGRLHKQRVEILGRVAGLWHRAKHVVVYHRTTAASPQFTPYPDQPTRTRRPVLRKVEEFVEILQPERRYPDIADVSQRSRGFVDEVRFNSRIIHVNSAWGSDVGEQGWEIPLWNRGEAELRPQIYPYPDVAFITAGEGLGDNPQTIQECLDVDHLYFYTDPVAAGITPDTDKWPIRNGIDTSTFGDLEFLRKVVAGIDKTVSSTTEEGRRAAAMRILPGLRRFTWRLAPSAVRTRINAERGDKPIFAGLESVTMMRAPGKASDKALADQLVERFNAEAPEDLISRDVKLPRSPGSGRDNWKAYEDVLRSLAAIEAESDINKKPFAGLRDALNALASKDGVKQIDAKLAAKGSLLDEAKAVFDKSSSFAQEALAFDQSECDAIASRAAGEIGKRKLLLLEMIRQAGTEAISAIDSLPDPSFENAKKLVRREILLVTNDLVLQASQGVGSVRTGIATARAIVRDWLSDAIAAMVRARARIKELRQSYDDEKPWSRNRFDEALKRLHDEFDAVDREAQAALAETRQRVAVEINGAASALGARITACIAQAVRASEKAFAVPITLSNQISDLTDIAVKKIPTQSAIDTKVSELQVYIDAIADKTQREAAQDILDTLKQTIATLKIDSKTQELQAQIDRLHEAADSFSSIAQSVVAKLANVLSDVQALISAMATASANFADAVLQEETTEFADAQQACADMIADLAKSAFLKWSRATTPVDVVVDDVTDWIDKQTVTIEGAAKTAFTVIDDWLAVFANKVNDAQAKMTDALNGAFEDQIVEPILDAVFIFEDWPATADEMRTHAKALIPQLSEKADAIIDKFVALPLAGIEDAKGLCAEFTRAKNLVTKGLENAANEASKLLTETLDGFRKDLEDVIADPTKWAAQAEAIKGNVASLLGATDELANQFAEAGENVRAYIDRGADILARAGNAKPTELPGLALQLISATTQAPEIASFRTNAERIRVLLDEANSVLETSPLRGMLNQLGDALKSLGLTVTFTEFGDTIRPDFGDGTPLRKLIDRISGLDLSKMLPRAMVTGGMANGVKISHDVDSRAGRAWVRADVNLPMPAREELFSAGPFTFFLRNSLLRAFMRADAAKDQKEVVVTDQATLTTTIEAVVAGQVMVALEDVAITYSSKDQLNFALDPRKIRVHQAMRFVQDTFGSIFGDELGGLKYIKEGGIPVGVEHDFTLPPMSLMCGTSGVSNIQITNHFSLRAYPDFVIANRCNISRRELPFVFSFFVIGGTGYIQIDTEYRPFDKRLRVVVEAAVGGSAALGFSFGPVSGSVFITLSVALGYQKLIGGPGGSEQGLSVSAVLVIAGNVSLWGMATVYLGITLSMSYQDSGKVNAFGMLSVELRISRWFKLTYSTQVTYQLRDGRTTTQSSSDVKVSGKYEDALKRFEALDKARKSL